jgi:DNA-directed RNA polymerase specialized sigma24 family protein
LECFITRRDEVAFEALVRRHGPMVLGLCRRLLRNPQDAEDAFQATFLVLVRKAASIRHSDGGTPQ